VRLLTIARQIKALTYDEMMEIANWFTMAVRSRGECDEYFDNSNPSEWADILSGWAETVIDEDEAQ
jgi:hypothetical protein